MIAWFKPSEKMPDAQVDIYIATNNGVFLELYNYGTCFDWSEFLDCYWAYASDFNFPEGDE